MFIAGTVNGQRYTYLRGPNFGPFLATTSPFSRYCTVYNSPLAIMLNIKKKKKKNPLDDFRGLTTDGRTMDDGCPPHDNSSAVQQHKSKVKTDKKGN